MKKLLSLALSGAMMISLLSGCSLFKADPTEPQTTPAATEPAVTTAPSTTEAPETEPSVDAFANPANVVVLSGPTGMGSVSLMENCDELGDASPFNISILTDNNEVVAQLSSGEADIAAIATNVASTLYNKTNANIQMLAVNTLGVLYILEKGDTVSNLEDLRGKTIWTTGQGANPEYTLNYLLSEAGLTVGEDVFVEFMTAPEVSAKMVSSDDGICMLPVPASVALMMTDSAVREAVNLNDAWTDLTGTSLTMGCIVARKDYIDENPEMIAQFLDAYEDSITYVSDSANLTASAQLVTDYGITPKTKIAELAIPKCNMTYMTGHEMQESIQAYFEVLFAANPASIGGFIPYDDFFYQG